MAVPIPESEPELFPAASARWERARLATAYEEAAECLWAQITEACQRSLTRAGRVEAALGEVLGLFERDAELAVLLVLTAPLSAEAGLADKHRLLADHLVELLEASVPRVSGARGKGGAREAIEAAFALCASYLQAEGNRGIGALKGPLGKILVGAAGPVRGRQRELSRG